MSDISTPEGLLAAFLKKARMAAIELEDARSALVRAERDQAETDRILADMRTYRFPQAHIDIVLALVAPEAQKVAAAQALLVAADTGSQAVRLARDLATRHIQLQGQGAAGSFYNNGGTASPGSGRRSDPPGAPSSGPGYAFKCPIAGCSCAGSLHEPSTFYQPSERVHHLERGYGSVKRLGEYVPWVGQLVTVRFDEPDSSGDYEAAVPTADLRHGREVAGSPTADPVVADPVSALHGGGRVRPSSMYLSMSDEVGRRGWVLTVDGVDHYILADGSQGDAVDAATDKLRELGIMEELGPDMNPDRLVFQTAAFNGRNYLVRMSQLP